MQRVDTIDRKVYILKYFYKINEKKFNGKLIFDQEQIYSIFYTIKY